VRREAAIKAREAAIRKKKAGELQSERDEKGCNPGFREWGGTEGGYNLRYAPATVAAVFVCGLVRAEEAV
jgi:hypothetical protein